MTTQVSVDTDEKLALIAHLMRRVGVGARQDLSLIHISEPTRPY